MPKRYPNKTKDRTRRVVAGDRSRDKSRTLDKLAEYDEFELKILKRIRVDIMDGMKPEDLREKYAHLVQGRILTRAICDDDQVAFNAARDILDRTEGKAKERIETKHEYEKLPREELESLLLTSLNDAKIEDEKTKH